MSLLTTFFHFSFMFYPSVTCIDVSQKKYCFLHLRSIFSGVITSKHRNGLVPGLSVSGLTALLTPNHSSGCNQNGLSPHVTLQTLSDNFLLANVVPTYLVYMGF